VNAAIAKVDAAIGRLVEGLAAQDLLNRVNLVIVSDHGMANVSPTKALFLDDLIDLSRVVTPTFGAAAGVDPLPGHETEIEKILLGPHQHMRCWRRQNIPPELHYGGNQRVPEIFCLAELGWSVGSHEQFALYPKLYGNHGYDPAEPTMQAFFLAHGPGFKTGVTLQPFNNVDVYPLLAKLMGLAAEPNDGRLSEVATALKDR